MTADPAAVTAALITQDVDVPSDTSPPCNPSPTSTHLDHPSVISPPKRKPNSSRRGKQYKCGHCHELGHNQKTCPRRQASAEAVAASAIQPLGVDTDLFVAQPGLGHAGPNGHALGYRTISLCKLDAAVEAANKRVAIFEKQVVNANTDQEFLEATLALEKAVAVLEKVASCAQRCAMVAHGFSMAGWTGGDAHEGRENKRLRLETPQTPSGVIQVVVPTGSNASADGTEGVDQESVGVQDVKEEGLE